jgi:hypothetical protein
MNKLKTLGLSALAGSLAVVSASAVELSVAGKTELTYISKDKAMTGNPFGMGNALTFSGSGDMNGMTATYLAVIGDGAQASATTSEVFASSLMTLDMGDAGKVGFDQGVGEFGVSTIDDKMPYAYEEIWTYTGASNGLRAAGGAHNVFGYSNTFGGAGVSFEYNPGNDIALGTDGATGDGGTSGDGVVASGYNFALSFAAADGLNLGLGHGSEDNDMVTTNGAASDASFTTGYATYAMGGATFGYQYSEAAGGRAAGYDQNHVQLMGASFSVNENLAISYNIMDNDFKVAGGQAGTTEETKGFGASYTMGSASVRVVSASTDNVGGSSGTNEEATEISLMLAF